MWISRSGRHIHQNDRSASVNFIWEQPNWWFCFYLLLWATKWNNMELMNGPRVSQPHSDREDANLYALRMIQAVWGPTWIISMLTCIVGIEDMTRRPNPIWMSCTVLKLFRLEKVRYWWCLSRLKLPNRRCPPAGESWMSLHKGNVHNRLVFHWWKSCVLGMALTWESTQWVLVMHSKRTSYFNKNWLVWCLLTILALI